ncbi:hypothetical protein [Ochrobactrum quorumnocens]|jgi:hypothetical protein|nr:hypothetical protein [[Ochrobactrum] quorumnocens]MDH7793606.1 hypothetical protein [Ochrobactrum sp. AN78]
MTDDLAQLCRDGVSLGYRRVEPGIRACRWQDAVIGLTVGCADLAR